MNCEEFRKAYIPHDDDPEVSMREHKDNCKECRDYVAEIDQTYEMLAREAGKIEGTDLKSRIMKTIETGGSPIKKRLISRSMISVAATIAIILAAGLALMRMDPTKAAVRVLERTIGSMEGLRCVDMLIEVRTDPFENFAYIDIDGEMVPHRMVSVLTQPRMWRLEKPGRTVLFNDGITYLWHQNERVGYTSAYEFSFIEQFKLFTDPRQIFEKEKQLAKYTNATYSVEHTDQSTILTVTTPAQGNYEKGLFLNTSLPDSDNRREYVFDRNSSLLKSLSVTIITGDKEIKVIELAEINYDTTTDFASLCCIPADRTWIDSQTLPDCDAFVGITASHAVRMLFEAIEKGDLTEVLPLIYYYDPQDILERYEGIKLIGVGEEFTAGSYAGTFVRYEIAYPDGTVGEGLIGVRNDNENKIWLVDGGL